MVVVVVLVVLVVVSVAVVVFVVVVFDVVLVVVDFGGMSLFKDLIRGNCIAVLYHQGKGETYQIVPFGSLTHLRVLKLQQVTPRR